MDPVKLLIPLAGIAFGCSIPLVALVADYRKRKLLLELHHKERMAAIDKGIELPPLSEAMLNDGHKEHKLRTPHADLGWGLFWLLGGLALFVALYLDRKESTTAYYALIPIAVGVHYLIYYFAVGKKEALLSQMEQRGRTVERP